MRLSAAAALLALALTSACGTNRDLIEVGTPTPRPAVPAVTASPTPSATPTAVPTLRPPRDPRPVPTPLPLTPIQGLFTDPRPLVAASEAQLPPAPSPTIAPAPGTRLDDTLLFDVQEQTVTNLGRGFRGAFSPDGTRMTWVRITSRPAGEVRLIDLTTLEQRRLGPGLDSAPWIDDETVLSVSEAAREQIAITVSNGAARPAPPFDPPSEPFVSTVRGDLQLVRLADGPPATFEVRDRSTGAMLLRFEAEAASLAGPGEVAIATPATGPDLDANIFLVDVEAATATFISSTRLTARPLIALSATANLVAWTDRFCSPDGTLRVLDRATGEARELAGAGWAVLTSDNQIALGEFGAQALFDLDANRYTAVLPAPQNEVTWSPDHRYASVGAQLEHGSRCP